MQKKIKRLPKKTLKNCPQKLLIHNWLGLAVFSPASFCFVQLRQFYSLKFSHLNIPVRVPVFAFPRSDFDLCLVKDRKL